jgi:5-hydroxyisourate hydrolase-like protein (transthyretin family)
MRKIAYILFFLVIVLSGCLGSKRKIKVKITDITTGAPVENITVSVGNIEHSSSASQVKQAKSNSNGLVEMTYSNAARKDAIRITIDAIGTGYHVVGNTHYNYLEYSKNVYLEVKVEK